MTDPANRLKESSQMLRLKPEAAEKVKEQEALRNAIEQERADMLAERNRQIREKALRGKKVKKKAAKKIRKTDSVAKKKINAQQFTAQKTNNKYERRRKHFLRTRLDFIMKYSILPKNRPLTLENIISGLRAYSEFSRLDDTELQEFAQLALNNYHKQSRTTSKSRAKQVSKQRIGYGAKLKSTDAMHRAILTGFETNRRRH